MNLRKPVTISLAAAVSLALAGAALADDHHHDSHSHVAHAPAVHVERHVDVRGAAWGHGDISHFQERDFDRWRGGHWVHDWHGNHFGWWWVVGGAWVFFNAPVYPYPDPYVPSTVVVQEDQATEPPATGAPPPMYWYYCPSAQNYYPYVTSCPVGWEPVPATSTPAAAPAAPPAPPANPTAPPPPPPSGDGN